MSIDFHRLMEPISNNLFIFIDYTDYVDCFPMIDFHRLDTPGFKLLCKKAVPLVFLYKLKKISITQVRSRIKQLSSRLQNYR